MSILSLNNNMTAPQKIRSDVVIDWTLKIASFIMSIAIMISSFFLTKAWDKISNLEKDIVELKIDASRTQSNRFSSNDWVTAKSILDSERLSMDRRLIRMEETIPMINDSISEIKQTIRRLDEK